MTEPAPASQYFATTSGTYSDAELSQRSDYAELQQARDAIIQAGIAIERLMGLPPEQRAVMSREERRSLTKTK
jgi:hypothetical protein